MAFISNIKFISGFSEGKLVRYSNLFNANGSISKLARLAIVNGESSVPSNPSAASTAGMPAKDQVGFKTATLTRVGKIVQQTLVNDPVIKDAIESAAMSALGKIKAEAISQPKDTPSGTDEQVIQQKYLMDKSITMTNVITGSTSLEGQLPVHDTISISIGKHVQNKILLDKSNGLSSSIIRAKYSNYQVGMVNNFNQNLIRNIVIMGAMAAEKFLDSSNNNTSFDNIPNIHRIIGGFTELLVSVVFVRILEMKENSTFISAVDRALSQGILIPRYWNIHSLIMGAEGSLNTCDIYVDGTTFKTNVKLSVELNLHDVYKSFSTELISSCVAEALYHAYSIPMEDTSVVIRQICDPNVSSLDFFKKLSGNGSSLGKLSGKTITARDFAALFSKDADIFTQGLVRFEVLMKWWFNNTNRSGLTIQSAFQFINKQYSETTQLPFDYGFSVLSGAFSFLPKGSILTPISFSYMNCFCITFKRQQKENVLNFIYDKYLGIRVDNPRYTSSKEVFQKTFSTLLFGTPISENVALSVSKAGLLTLSAKTINPKTGSGENREINNSESENTDQASDPADSFAKSKANTQLGARKPRGINSSIRTIVMNTLTGKTINKILFKLNNTYNSYNDSS